MTGRSPEDETRYLEEALNKLDEKQLAVAAQRLRISHEHVLQTAAELRALYEFAPEQFDGIDEAHILLNVEAVNGAELIQALVPQFHNLGTAAQELLDAGLLAHTFPGGRPSAFVPQDSPPAADDFIPTDADASFWSRANGTAPAHRMLEIPDFALKDVEPEEQETLIGFVPVSALLRARELIEEVEEEAVYGMAKSALGVLLSGAERTSWKVARARLGLHRLQDFVGAFHRVAVTHRVPRLLVLRELAELIRLYEAGGLQTTVVEDLSRFRREIQLCWPGGEQTTANDFLDTDFGSLGSPNSLGSLG